MAIGFGGKYYSAPSPIAIKCLAYLAVLFMAMADNVDAIQKGWGLIEWFKWFIVCLKFPAALFVSHMFGKKSLNDTASGKN